MAQSSLVHRVSRSFLINRYLIISCIELVRLETCFFLLLRFPIRFWRVLVIISIKFRGGFALPRNLLSQKLITNTSSPRSPLPTRLNSHKHEPPMNFDHDSSVITIDDDSPDLHRLRRTKASNKIHSPVVPGSRQCTGSPEKIPTTS